MDLRPPLRRDEGERLAIIEMQNFRMNCGKSDGKTGRTAALRTRPERTSTKSDQRNFALLGFSEVRAQNPVFSSPYSQTSANGDSRKFAPRNSYMAYKDSP
jgi:hypothetical protein